MLEYAAILIFAFASICGSIHTNISAIHKQNIAEQNGVHDHLKRELFNAEPNHSQPKSDMRLFYTNFDAISSSSVQAYNIIRNFEGKRFGRNAFKN